MTKTHITVSHRLPQAAFSQANILAQSTSLGVCKASPDIIQIDLPLPCIASEAEELIAFLAFLPSLGAAVADSLEGAGCSVKTIQIEITQDDKAAPSDALPREVAARLNSLLDV